MPLTMWLSRLETANRSSAQSRQQDHALPAFTRALVAPPRALELAWPEGVRLRAAFFLNPLSFGAMSPIGHLADVGALPNIRFAKSGRSSNVAFDPTETWAPEHVV